VNIEPMAESDLDAVVAIDLASFPHGDIGGERAAREKGLREELARPWARLRVARDPALGVAGYILFWHVADELHLLNVAVAPAARRRGVGRALVLDLLAYAQGSAAAKVLLEVRASNEPAIRLYEGLGFVRFNVRRAYYADGEDGVEMMLGL
jgi:ribosomal-protein-alanine N-acetyltransferase